VACPWLIKRFIDPRAEFLFVPEEELLEKARQEEAIPFGATQFSELRLNHHGERCTFEAILEDYKLTDPALHRLGFIVRGADVKGREEAAPESSGLRAIAQGFALSAGSDEERLAHQFPIYDALLEYVRQQTGFDTRKRSASSPPDLWRFFR
jgi:hypothetical protein